MRILSWEDFSLSRERERSLAAAVGAFDGLHRGHQELIGRVTARREDVKAVITFKENPKKLLRPAAYHGDLATLEQKLSGIESLGLDLCVLIDFSGDFSKLAGRKFLYVLKESGNLGFLAVGSDFRCGHRLDTSAEDIKSYYGEMGVETELLGAVHWAGHAISSSRIRKAVVEGRLDDAKAMLGHPYEVDLHGLVRTIRAEGSLVYTVAGSQVQPPDGSYAVTVVGKNGAIEAEASIAEGQWLVRSSEGLEPRCLRLMKSVSRV